MRHPARRTAPSLKENRFQHFFSNLGPGLITGAADDDPSGHLDLFGGGRRVRIPAALDGAVLSFPLMTAVQLMCARLGLVTGLGLAGVIRRRYAPWVLWSACTLLVVANVINIAADLGGMAEATAMVTGAPVALMVPVYGVAIVSLLMWSSYRVDRARVQVADARAPRLRAHGLRGGRRLADSPSRRRSFRTWNGRGRSSPSWSRSSARRSRRICSSGRRRRKSRKSAPRAATWRTAAARRAPSSTPAAPTSSTGMFASNAIMYFIIMTTAATLHAHGKTNIATAQQAAEALRPLAGAGAYWLFTLGLIGTGMLAVPVLAGSCAYAIAEASAWRGSLDRPPGRAKKFYVVLAVAMALGIALNYAGLNAIRLLFTTAVINGVLAPPLILIVLLLTGDRTVMGDAVNSRTLALLGWLAFAVMVVAALGLFFAS